MRGLGWDLGRKLTAPLDTRITSLEDTYVRACWFEEIASGTSGTLTLPTGGGVVLNQWEGGVDALASKISSSWPSFESPVNAGGTVITATLDTSGNWGLSDTPSSYPVAIIYIYRVKLVSFNDTYSMFEAELEPVDVAANTAARHTQGTDTALGTQAQNLNMGTHKIIGVVDPTANQEAATKKYVDDSSINNLVEDTTPQLGGNLDGQDKEITNVAKLGVGVETPTSVCDVICEDTIGVVLFKKCHTSTGGAAFRQEKARGTFANPAVVAVNDTLGGFSCFGYTGSGFVKIGEIKSVISVVSGTNLSGKIMFKTAIANVLSEQMRIAADGGVFMYNLKSGINQAGAGAVAGELWYDTDDDNTVKMGV